MILDQRLRAGAEALREEADRLATHLTSPRPRKRGMSPTAAAVVSLAVVIVSVVTLVWAQPFSQPPAIESPAAPTSTTITAPSAPDGWTTHVMADIGVQYVLPEEGWLVIEESLTPHIDRAPAAISDRYLDTIVSFSTNPTPVSFGPPAFACVLRPQAALEQLGADDALISVLEIAPFRAGEYPDRRRATGIYEGAPEQFYPYIGEPIRDFCADRANANRSEPLFLRSYIYNDRGRAFNVTVAIGHEASDETRVQVWTILDGLTFSAPFSE